MSFSVETNAARQSGYAGNASAPVEVALRPADENTPAEQGFSFFGDDGFTFGDLIDVINPLQHIPVVSTFYRDATGDNIAPAPRVAGSTLFFGPIGLVSALANVFVEEETGKDIGDHVASWAGVDFSTQDTPEIIASYDENDPVSAWARAEVAWAQQQTAPQRGPSAPAKTTPQALPRSAESASEVPDATQVLSGDARWASLSGAAEVATLTRDARSAAWAYQAAAGLGRTNQVPTTL